MDDDYGGNDAGEPNYSGLDESWRDISPDFGGSGESDFVKAERARGNSFVDQERAREQGRASEDGAAKGSGGSSKGGRDAAREAENANDGFQNNVMGKDEKKKGRGKGFLKKSGPLGLLLTVLIGSAGLVGSSQILAPFGLIANGLDMFNSLRTGMSTREVRLIKAQLGVRSASASGMYSVEGMTITEEQIQRYRRNGIYYYEGSVRMLIYQDRDSGKWLGVVGSEGLIGSAPHSVEIDGRSFNLDEILDLDTALEEYDDFYVASSRSTRITKGHISGWYDTPSMLYLQRMGGSLLRRRHGEKNKEKTDGEIESDARKGGLDDNVAASRTDDGDSENDEKMYKENEDNKTFKDLNPSNEVDENPDGANPMDFYLPEDEGTEVEVDDGNGGKKTERRPWWIGYNDGGNEDDSATRGASRAEVETSFANRAMRIAASVGQVADIACTALKISAGINAVIGAIQVANIINWLTGFLEAIDKTKSGDGGNELAYYMNQLTSKGDMMGTDPESGEDILIKSNTSALESPAFNQFFGGSAISSSDLGAQKFNIESATKASIAGAGGLMGAALAAGGAFNNSIEAYRACLAMQGINNIVDVVGDIISFGWKALFEGVINTAKSVAVQSIIGGFISMIAPKVVQWLAIDLISNMVGEDAAYAMNSGFNILLGRQHQTSSGKPGTHEQVVAMHRENQKILAQEARYDRLTHSPFDITNKNTFLGSLAYAAIPIGISMGASPLSVVSKVVNQVGSSALSLFPTVEAAGIDTWYELSLVDDCPSLSQIGLVGDAYCNPYFVDDIDSMKVDDPAAIFEEVCNMDDNFEKGCDAEGEDDGYAYAPEIKPGSELSKWVVACTKRDAPYGIVDGQTMSQVKENPLGLSDIAAKGVSAVPILGSFYSLADGAFEWDSVEWASGKRCTEEKYDAYSVFSEDQRALENAGLVKKSSVAVFMEKYYEANPIDNSYEGVIARYSGLAKETVEDILAFMDYAEYLAQYDASERKQLVTEDSAEFYYENNDCDEVNAVITGRIIYFDLRQRTLVA